MNIVDPDKYTFADMFDQIHVDEVLHVKGGNNILPGNG